VIRIIRNIVAIVLLLVAAIVAYQELLIFPILWCGVLPKVVASKCDYREAIPDGVESLAIPSNDGAALLQSFRRQAKDAHEEFGLVFHGNGETIFPYHFLPFLNAVGITSYNVDYRGYGNSTGWPSEGGIYNDAESLWRYVQDREKTDSSHLTILGNSIGSGPAAYLASKLHPKILILIAPFESIPKVVQKSPIYKYFIPVLRYQFPVSEYLSKLDERTCVILAHGESDEVIPVGHTHNLEKVLPHKVRRIALYSPEANHRDIYYKVEERLLEAVRSCDK
jgi:fermentation-respiration switch protein FrsA (DUF1100 family)